MRLTFNEGEEPMWRAEQVEKLRWIVTVMSPLLIEALYLLFPNRVCNFVLTTPCLPDQMSEPFKPKRSTVRNARSEKSVVDLGTL
jgi:hypothetical protein